MGEHQPRCFHYPCRSLTVLCQTQLCSRPALFGTMFAACLWNNGPWGFQTLLISSRHLPSAGIYSTGYNVKSTRRHKAHQEFNSYFFRVFLKTKVAPPFFPPVSKLCVKYGLTTLYMKIWNKLSENLKKKM